jgi:hypothetical protein
MTKSIRVPGQIRRYVLKEMEPATNGEKHLLAACEEGDKALKAREMSVLNTIDLNLTNAALGVALDIARDWLDSDNGNNVMAGKSMLKFELEYEPDDPRELRHQIKMPKSLAGHFDAPYTSEFKNSKRIPAAVKADMKGMSWTSTGAAGRVRSEALAWFLDKMNGLMDNPHPATSRAARKFVTTYAGEYAKTLRLINGYLGIGDDEDQAPEPEKEILTADDFKAAIRGRGPELGDDEPDEDQAPEPAVVEERAPAGGYEVPANFLELAEEGDTPQARAYWTRRCEEYRRTGK